MKAKKKFEKKVFEGKKMDSKKLKFESKYLFISVLCAASWHKYHSIKPKRTKTA